LEAAVASVVEEEEAGVVIVVVVVVTTVFDIISFPPPVLDPVPGTVTDVAEAVVEEVLTGLVDEITRLFLFSFSSTISIFETNTRQWARLRSVAQEAYRQRGTPKRFEKKNLGKEQTVMRILKRQELFSVSFFLSRRENGRSKDSKDLCDL
jgi:hypothetical protein